MQTIGTAGKCYDCSVASGQFELINGMGEIAIVRHLLKLKKLSVQQNFKIANNVEE